MFEKEVRVVVHALLPDAVLWDELLKETSWDPELTELKNAIARGYFTSQESRILGPQLDPVFTE